MAGASSFLITDRNRHPAFCEAALRLLLMIITELLMFVFEMQIKPLDLHSPNCF